MILKNTLIWLHVKRFNGSECVRNLSCRIKELVTDKLSMFESTSCHEIHVQDDAADINDGLGIVHMWLCKYTEYLVKQLICHFLDLMIIYCSFDRYNTTTNNYYY